MPTVSVIIPTFNHCGLVLETLESVFAQTWSDYEVIVVNDGSPDGTAEVLAPLAKAGRIVYIEQANAGQAAARNRGLAEAHGEYIAFLDDDDLWPVDKLAWQVGALERNGDLSAVGGAAITIDVSGNILPSRPSYVDRELCLEDLFDGCPFLSPGQVLLRGDALRRAGGLNTRLWGADDFDLWFRVAQHGRLICTSKLALHYRVHHSNASRDIFRMLANSRAVVDEHLQKLHGGARRRCNRKAYRYLYQWAGRRILSRALKSAVKGDISNAGRFFQSVGFFAGPALADHELLRLVCGDVFRPWLWSTNSNWG